MIDIIFEFGNEIILVKIKGSKVLFGNTLFGAQMADISGLTLDYKGVCRQFPDLETNDNWRQEAIKRFKRKIQGLGSEKQIADYIIDDLKEHGYIARKYQKSGHRWVMI